MDSDVELLVLGNIYTVLAGRYCGGLAAAAVSGGGGHLSGLSDGGIERGGNTLFFLSL